MSKKTKEKKIKVTVENKRKKSAPKDLDKSGPQVNDIRNRSSRWRSLPTKNVVKIKEEEKAKRSTFYNFYKGLFFVFVGILGIMAIAVFSYWQIFAVQRTTAALVPENTIIYGQIDINGLLFPDGQKDKPLSDLADDLNPIVKQGTTFIDRNTEPLGVKFVTDIKPFLGEKLHFAYFPSQIESNGEENKPNNNWGIIVDLFDKTAAEAVLQKLEYKAQISRQDYQGTEIISVNKPDGSLLTHCFFLDNHLVLSYSLEHAQTIVKANQQEIATLAQSGQLTNFNPITLRNKFFYAYLHPTESDLLTSASGNMLELLDLFGSKVKEAQMTAEAKEGGMLLEINTQNNEAINAGDRISRDLFEYLAVNTSSFFAGDDFYNDFTQLREDLSSNSPTAEFHLNSFVRGIEERSRINLSDDFLQYLTSDYIIALDHTDNNTNYSLIVKLPGEKKAQAQATALEEAVINYLAVTHPVKKEMVLSDGSKAQELFPDQKAFKFSDLDYSGMNIRSIDSPELSENFSYIIIEDKLLLSTSLESLKNMLSTGDSKTSGKLLTNKRYFSVPYSEATDWQSEGVFYSDVDALISYLKLEKGQTKYIEPFDTILISSHSQGGNNTTWQGFLYSEENK